MPLYEHDATKGALVGAMADATHLHLACHGSFDLGFPPDSGLLLANDEELTLGELLYGEVEMPRLRLAVLSACQSAISDFGGLPDEYVGLPTALLQAGIPGVVGTLWPVNDYTTALLMSRFYELHLRGVPASGEGPMRPARALCEAQRWLRHVGAKELLDYLDDHPALDRAVRSRASGDLAAQAARGSAGPLDQPLFDAPVAWAPFVFLGA
jgi:CHAT domain-containing protein